MRRVLLALAWIVAMFVAHAGLERAAFLGRDLVLLREVARVVNEVPRTLEERCGWLADGSVKPIAGLSLLAQRELGPPSSPLTPEGARGLRVANLILLVVGALAAGRALRRGLEPWLGEGAALAAGRAFRILATVHPVAVSVVARASFHGDLWAFALGSLALVWFVEARPTRDPVRYSLAAASAVLAGFSSPGAWLVPPLAIVAELAHRSAVTSTLRRARSVLLAGAVASSCVALEPVVLAFVSAAHAPSAGVFAAGRDWLALVFAGPAPLERLGIAFVPALGEQVAVESYALGGAVLLVAAWPLLRAARSAPRSFGRLGLAWLVVALIALAPGASVGAEPRDLEHAGRVFPAALAVCAGLAVATTALSGDRRWVVPAIVVTGWLPLAHGVGAAWANATVELDAWRAEIARARAAVECRELLVVDPVTASNGLDLYAQDLALLVDPWLVRDESTVPPPRVRSIRGGALALLLREPEVEALRVRGLAIDLPRALATDSAELGAPSVNDRAVIAVPPPRANEALPMWRGQLRSEFLALDPLRVRALRVRALPECGTADSPRMSYRSAAGDELVSRVGVWLTNPQGPVALFDLQSSLAWSLCGEVHRISLESPNQNVGSIETLADDALQIEALDPSVSGDDWTFRVPPEAVPKPVHGSVRWMLTILAVHDFTASEFTGRPAADGSERFPGAARFAAEARARAEALGLAQGGTLAYALEARVGDMCIGRVRGRL